MEQTLLIKIIAAIKWLFPTALGSAIAVAIGDKNQPKTSKVEMLFKKVCAFVTGVVTGTIIGGFFIEYWNIPVGAIQTAIYLGSGLWGMGLLIQVYVQLPLIVQSIRGALQTALEKWLSK